MTGQLAREQVSGMIYTQLNLGFQFSISDINHFYFVEPAKQSHPDSVMIAMIAPVAFLSGLIFNCKVVLVATWKA